MTPRESGPNTFESRLLCSSPAVRCCGRFIHLAVRKILKNVHLSFVHSPFLMTGHHTIFFFSHLDPRGKIWFFFFWHHYSSHSSFLFLFSDRLIITHHNRHFRYRTRRVPGPQSRPSTRPRRAPWRIRMAKRRLRSVLPEQSRPHVSVNPTQARKITHPSCFL